MKEIIGIISAGLVFVAYAPFLRDISKGKSIPHPYSYFIWGFISFLIFALQLTHGAGAGSYTTVTAAAINSGVFIFAVKKHGARDIKFIDTVFLVMAFVAIAIWLFAKQPGLSMVLLITADLLGIAPSVRKAWHKPNEETLFMWGMSGVRHTLAIIALQTYNLISLLNPLVWAIADSAFTLLLIFRKKILKLS